LENIPIPVDADGIAVERPVPKARLAYVTPTHQMPLNVRLADDRCKSLIEWARTEDAWIIEDDYDSEFRYVGQPVVALQHSDPDGRVIHIGTFSKTLFQSLRIAYLIVPKRLSASAAEAVFLNGEPTLHVQAALSDFVAEGHYAMHIRKARLVYRRRQGLLVDALNFHLEGILAISQPPGGMHVVVPFPSDIPAQSVQSAAAKEALFVRPVSYYTAKWPAPNALQLGFAAVPDRQIEPAVNRLARVIRAIRTGSVNLR
jgi:GntR family transcriptional regulator/MocR family aminotransferase